MSDQEREDRKDAMKEAMTEFLEKQKQETYETLGKWALGFFVTAFVAGIAWLILHIEKIKN